MADTIFFLLSSLVKRSSSTRILKTTLNGLRVSLCPFTAPFRCDHVLVTNWCLRVFT
jgi:hypothetical protein